MKTSDWIKIIGILCIVFGSLGTINHILEILTPRITETNDDNSAYFSAVTTKWNVFLSYLGIFVNALYIISGVLFINRKTYSLKLMYFALSTGIIYTIVPIIIKNNNGIAGLFSYLSNIFFLFLVGIDVALLIGVYFISGYYYKSPEEITKLKAQKESKSLIVSHLKTMTFIGLSFLIIPLSIFGIWFYSASARDTQSERVKIFKGFFPEFLQGTNDISYLTIIFCFLAIITSILCLQYSKKSWWKINMITLVFSSLLTLISLFGLM
jgi:hypothetical protein